MKVYWRGCEICLNSKLEKDILGVSIVLHIPSELGYGTQDVQKVISRDTDRKHSIVCTDAYGLLL